VHHHEDLKNSLEGLYCACPPHPDTDLPSSPSMFAAGPCLLITVAFSSGRRKKYGKKEKNK
jgi:hypothetical protein